MKYLILLALLGACSGKFVDNDQRIRDEAKAFCSCRGGISTLTYNPYALLLECYNGARLTTKGITEEQHIYSDCKNDLGP